MGLFDRVRGEDDPTLTAAKQTAQACLPPGWTLAEDDREGFLLPGVTQISLDVWAAAAEGPDGKLELAIACDKAGAYNALAARLRGELATSESWAPPLQHVERR
jgi:hypothetical protein